jgi:hypothetical protein
LEVQEATTEGLICLVETYRRILVRDMGEDIKAVFSEVRSNRRYRYDEAGIEARTIPAAVQEDVAMQDAAASEF